MAVLRCTQKLLKALGIAPCDETTGLGWHANLLRFDHYRCVIFTHDATLFSFLTYPLGRLDDEHVSELFGQGLFKALLRSGLSQEQIECMLDTARDIQVARTNNRRVLGTMNDMASMLEWVIRQAGGVTNADPAELQRLLNETPYKAIGYDEPLQRLRRSLKPSGID
jgi:hypothetical protein